MSISFDIQGEAQQHMDPASAPPNSVVTIMIKNPNGSDQDFSLEVPLADTCVRDVKRLLHEKHPEHPEPSTQRLICLLYTSPSPRD